MTVSSAPTTISTDVRPDILAVSVLDDTLLTAASPFQTEVITKVKNSSDDVLKEKIEIDGIEKELEAWVNDLDSDINSLTTIAKDYAMFFVDKYDVEKNWSKDIDGDGEVDVIISKNSLARIYPQENTPGPVMFGNMTMGNMLEQMLLFTFQMELKIEELIQVLKASSDATISTTVANKAQEILTNNVGKVNNNLSQHYSAKEFKKYYGFSL